MPQQLSEIRQVARRQNATAVGGVGQDREHGLDLGPPAGLGNQGQHPVEHQPQFFGATHGGDQSQNLLPFRRGQRFPGEQLQQWGGDARSARGAQGECQTAHITPKDGFASLQGGEPVRLQIADCLPEGEIQIAIQRTFHRANRDLGRGS